MASENRQLHFMFLPIFAHGHMIPMTDMARLFASRGVKATILVTPANATRISKYIRKANVNILIFKYSFEMAGLPAGCEHLDDIPPQFLHILPLVTQTMQEPVSQILRDHRPDCFVADASYSWATDVACRYNIPRLSFHGSSSFTACVFESISSYCDLNKTLSSDSEPFVVPNLPDVVQLTRKQLPDFLICDKESEIGKVVKVARESQFKNYGDVVNSFYELEPAYAEHFRKEHGLKTWHVGPLSLCIRDIEEKMNRGNVATIDEHECLKWLNSKEPNSVIYISFGSTVYFGSSQLREIASALETSGHQFIWVVRSRTKSSEEEAEPEDLLPEGFEKKTEGKGLIVRGWAPQLLILEHKAIGAFVTHCGWNSVLEAISAGLPMVTWPTAGDQFCNEKLLTQILKIGFSIGEKTWDMSGGGDFVQSDVIENAMHRVMAGEVAEEMRERAKALAESAKGAVQEGGSSIVSLDSLIQEIASLRNIH